jgi:hypothetical protein
MSKLQTLIINKNNSKINIESNQFIKNINIIGYNICFDDISNLQNIIYLQFINDSTQLCPFSQTKINNNINNVLTNTIPINITDYNISNNIIISNNFYINYPIYYNCNINTLQCQILSTNNNKIELIFNLLDRELNKLNFNNINIILQINFL